MEGNNKGEDNPSDNKTNDGVKIEEGKNKEKEK